jgi:hypothetical protein
MATTVLAALFAIVAGARIRLPTGIEFVQDIC